MVIDPYDRIVWVSFRHKGKRRLGQIIGYVCRRRRIHAIVASKTDAIGVPLEGLKIVKSRKPKK